MKKNLTLLIILFSILLNGFGVDIYTPSLPVIQNYFNTSAELVQLSVGAYLVGFALIQLVIGTVCDTLGRRKPYLVAMGIYILTSICITQVNNIHELLLCRFIQGLSVGCFVLSARSMTVDLFQGKALQSVSNYVSLSWSIGPIIAPIIGGYLQHYFHWQASFYLLSLCGFVCWVAFYFYAPETLLEKQTFNLKHVFKTYKIVLMHKEFWLCNFILGFTYSLLVLFNVVTPFLIENVMGYSVVTYSYISLSMGFVWFLGNFHNKMLSETEKSTKAKYCFFFSCLSALLLLILSLKFLTLYTLIIPIGIIFYCGGFIFSLYYAHNMSMLPSAIAATASALMGTTVVSTSAFFGSFLGSQLHANTAVPFAALLLLFVLICSALSFFEHRFYIKSHSSD